MASEKQTNKTSPTPESKSAMPIVLAVIVIAAIALGVVYVATRDNDKSTTHKDTSGFMLSDTPNTPTEIAEEYLESKESIEPEKSTKLQDTITSKLTGDTSQKKEEKTQPATLQRVTDSTESEQSGSSSPVATSPGVPPIARTQVAIPQQNTLAQPMPPVQPKPIAGVARPVQVTQNIRPRSASELIGAGRPDILPQSTRLAMRAKREKLYTEEELNELPAELADEKPQSISKVFLPDGTKMFMTYDDNGAPAKAVVVEADGTTTVKQIDSAGKVSSVVRNGETTQYTYSKTSEGTRVTLTDDMGNALGQRMYNDKGLLVKTIDPAGGTLTYDYTFDDGEPVSYTLIDEQGAVVAEKDITAVDETDLGVLSFGVQPSENSFNYEYNENGDLVRIIENQGTDKEVVRQLDENRNLIKLTKTKQKLTYEYVYDEADELMAIKITDATGAVRTIDRNDPDFSMIESETEVFNPIEYSDMINAQKNIKQYRDENLINQQLKRQLEYNSITNANDLNLKSGVPQQIQPYAPGSPAAGANPATSAPKNPAGPKGVSIPKRY